MQSINLPTDIEFSEEEDNAYQVSISPCEKGYGHTVGNAFRRVLLSSLPGASVESVKVEGVQHEFSTVDGVLEDMVEIILNLKELALEVHSDESVTLNLNAEGEQEVTAEDFEDNADVNIINPDLKLFSTIDEDAEVNMEVTVGTGTGYIKASDKDTEDWPLGVIAIDSHYSPIRNVGYDVEKTRVGDITDYDKVTLDIETNGSINGKEAVENASEILLDHFSLVNKAAKGEEIEVSEEE